MKIIIKDLIPISVEAFNKNNKKVRYAGKDVGKIIEFIITDNGIDAIAEITNKKLISKLRNENKCSLETPHLQHKDCKK
jgi:hypothetical protein